MNNSDFFKDYKPKRRAGTYIKEQLESKADDFIAFGVSTTCVALIAIWQWYMRIANQPASIESCWSVTLCAVAMIAATFWKMKKFKEGAKTRKLGLLGECYTEELLEDMALKYDWSVVSDFQTGSGNIDHIVISDRGVFCIETKTWTPKTPGEEIKYNGACLQIGALKIEKPIEQAWAEKKALSDFLAEKHPNLKSPVYAIVFFPMRKVKPNYNGSPEVAACDENGLERYMSCKSKIPHLANRNDRMTIYRRLRDEQKAMEAARN